MEPYQLLEQKFAEWNELPPENMVACSSGTASLHLALEALQLPQGSEVITSDFNMIAVPRAIIMAGHRPVFWDCGEDLLLDMNLLPRGNGVRRCFLLTHIYGRRCNLETLEAWRKNWLSSPTMVIEDLAEAHGIKPHSDTDAACWSFYRNKIIAGEEGGAVYFKQVEHAKLARQLRSLGFTDKHDFNHIPRGHNYRMSNCHAELILKSLEKVWENWSTRRVLENLYNQYCPSEWKMPYRNAPWVYDIRIRGMSSAVQDRVVAGLNQYGLAARHAFKPMSYQEEFNKTRVYEGNNAYIASREVIYLPLKFDSDGTRCKQDIEKIQELLANEKTSASR